MKDSFLNDEGRTVWSAASQLIRIRRETVAAWMLNGFSDPGHSSDRKVACFGVES